MAFVNGQRQADSDIPQIGSSTDNGIVRWDGTGGDTVQDSTNCTVDDNGKITAQGGWEVTS